MLLHNRISGFFEIINDLTWSDTSSCGWTDRAIHPEVNDSNAAALIERVAQRR